MFSQKIVGSDAFIEMPVSARELYFQLGMYADDDGFINPKKIIRMLGASDDDLKILAGKRFVLPFENGVVVIKHWKINNLIRKDFYEETIYLEQKNRLTLKDNKAYTENVNNLSPQYSIDKDSIDKVNSITEPSSVEKKPINEVLKEFYEINPTLNFGHAGYRKAAEELLNKFPLDQLISMIKWYKGVMSDRFCPVATTPLAFKNKLGDIKAYADKLKTNSRFTTI